MSSDKFHGYSVSSDTDCTRTSYVYHGTKAEMEELAAQHYIDETGQAGWLRLIRVYQREGTVWECELKYEAPEDWTLISVPNRTWGSKSCQLRGAMLSRPLESHPKYRTRWNHNLCGAPGTGVLPAWYNDATDTTIPAADAARYCWCRHLAEIPRDDNGRWTLLATPTKPGVESYDVATYTITETARFRSASAAGRMAAGMINRIGTPSNSFGITGGNWKCDDAEVSWNGRYWLARLTWTSSGDGGWDSEIYG
jgi:hypothetical protein